MSPLGAWAPRSAAAAQPTMPASTSASTPAAAAAASAMRHHATPQRPKLGFAAPRYRAAATPVPVLRPRETVRSPVSTSSSSSLGAVGPLQPSSSSTFGGRWYGLSSPHDQEVVSVALPAMCAMLMEPIVSSINSAFIGQIGTFELGAVSIGSLAVSFNTMLFSFLLFLTIPEISAAVAKKDSNEVSKVGAKSLWLAAGCGVVTCAATFLGADAIVRYLKPAEPAVAQLAADYIRVRAFGIVPALTAYVATAVFRGHKDTKTPLMAAFASAACSLTLSVLFIQVWQWGVFGSALASTLAAMLACGVMCSQMLLKGMVRLRDLVTPPPLDTLLPLLRAAGPLSLRTVITFGMVLYASSLCVRAGSVYQASFEVIRQAWALTLASFECLNVATQVLCATYLGSGDVDAARSVLLRILFLGVGCGVLTGLPLFLFQEQFAHSFSSDPAVIAQVLQTLPLVALFVPLDALGSIMDGSLMASKQTDYLSLIQIVCAGFQFLALQYVTQNSLVSCLAIWGCLKLMTLFRVAGGFGRNFVYARSVYLVPSPRPRPPEQRHELEAAPGLAATNGRLNGASNGAAEVHVNAVEAGARVHAVHEAGEAGARVHAGHEAGEPGLHHPAGQAPPPLVLCAADGEGRVSSAGEVKQ